MPVHFRQSPPQPILKTHLYSLAFDRALYIDLTCLCFIMGACLCFYSILVVFNGPAFIHFWLQHFVFAVVVLKVLYKYCTLNV